MLPALLAAILAAVPAPAPRAGAAARASLPACATAPLRSTGTVTYFCDCRTGAAPGCVPGSDGNRGTSPAAPRRTLRAAFARFNEMKAGDTVALCRGGAWDEFQLGEVDNPRCSASSPATWCEFRDYVPRWGSAATPPPRLNVDGAAPAAFTMRSRGNHDGYRIWNLDLRMTSRGGPGDQPEFVFIYKDPPTGVSYTHVDLCNLSFTNGYIAVQAAGAGHTIRDSRFVRCGWQGILGGDDDWLIDGNTFLNCGDQKTEPRQTARHHAMYLITSLPGHIRRMRVANNHVRFDPDGVNGYGECRGTAVVLRGGQEDTVFENNLIEGAQPYPCFPLAVAASGEPAEHVRTVIRRNRIRWRAHDPHVLVQVDYCRDCVIEANVLESDVPLSYAALMAPVQTAASDGRPGAGRTTGTVVRNNTVRIPGGTGLRIAAPQLGTDREGTGFVVENNVVVTGKGSTCTQVGWPTAPGHPFTEALYPKPSANPAGNYCVNTGAGPEVVFRNPAAGDYRPLVPGPLAGTANQTSFAPVAPASLAWDPLDPGAVRVAPVDVGAFLR